MSRHRVLIVVCGLVAGIQAAGCGDDGGNGGATQGPPPSKSEYIARGDQICAEGSLIIAQRFRQRFERQPEGTTQVAEFSREVVVPVLERQLERLRALTPPPGDETEVDAIYDAVERGVAEVRRRPWVIGQPGVGGVFEQANERARAYGFERCEKG
jgi:hypothetical protein